MWAWCPFVSGNTVFQFKRPTYLLKKSVASYHTGTCSASYSWCHMHPVPVAIVRLQPLSVPKPPTTQPLPFNSWQCLPFLGYRHPSCPKYTMWPLYLRHLLNLCIAKTNFHFHSYNHYTRDSFHDYCLGFIFYLKKVSYVLNSIKLLSSGRRIAVRAGHQSNHST